ncbi:MAG: Fur family transcriptional regulator [Planctomycetota bacterium]
MFDPVDILRKYGIPITAQRLSVLRAVSNHPHNTADTIAEVVRTDIGAISRQAVYDALKMLSEKGILRRVHSAGSSLLYEVRISDHHHFICRTCGKMIDIACAIGETPCLTPSTELAYQLDEVEVIYWGICPKCLSETSESGV